MSTIPGVLDSTDDIPPTVTLTNPPAGNVAGTVTLQATAADNDKIASCQFTADAANVGSPITAPPYQLSYDTHALVNGAHTIGVNVKDRVRGSASSSHAVTVKNGPAVNFYSPGNGATVTGTIYPTAYVTNYGTGVSVLFQWDGNNIGGWQSGGTGYYQVGLDTHGLAVGWHTFSCIAQDAQGNQTVAQNSYYVNNQPPGAGTVAWGDYQYWDDWYDPSNPFWDSERTNPQPYDGQGGTWIWSNVGAKLGPIYLPGNPNPTYYQMRAWFSCGRTEGGDPGQNTVYIDWRIAGITDNNQDAGGEYGWQNVWVNGDSQSPPQDYGNFGPYAYPNGGEACYCKRWATNPGWNTCFALGIGIYYDFVPKYAS